MMEEDRCPRTDLLRDQCAHCRPAPARPVPVVDEYGTPFRSIYHGHCAEECGHPIRPEQLIRALRDGGGYAHDGCVQP